MSSPSGGDVAPSRAPGCIRKRGPGFFRGCTIAAEHGHANELLWAPGGGFIASRSTGSPPTAWAVSSTQPLARLFELSAVCVAWGGTSQSPTLYALTHDRGACANNTWCLCLREINHATGQVERSFTLQYQPCDGLPREYGMDVHPVDGRFIAIASPGGVKIVEWGPDHQAVHALDVHEGRAQSAHWVLRGARVFLGVCNDTLFRAYPIDMGTLIALPAVPYQPGEAVRIHEATVNRSLGTFVVTTEKGVVVMTMSDTGNRVECVSVDASASPVGGFLRASVTDSWKLLVVGERGLAVFNCANGKLKGFSAVPQGELFYCDTPALFSCAPGDVAFVQTTNFVSVCDSRGKRMLIPDAFRITDGAPIALTALVRDPAPDISLGPLPRVALSDVVVPFSPEDDPCAAFQYPPIVNPDPFNDRGPVDFHSPDVSVDSKHLTRAVDRPDRLVAMGGIPEDERPIISNDTAEFVSRSPDNLKMASVDYRVVPGEPPALAIATWLVDAPRHELGVAACLGERLNRLSWERTSTFFFVDTNLRDMVFKVDRGSAKLVVTASKGDIPTTAFWGGGSSPCLLVGRRGDLMAFPLEEKSVLVSVDTPLPLGTGGLVSVCPLGRTVVYEHMRQGRTSVLVGSLFAASVDEHKELIVVNGELLSLGITGRGIIEVQWYNTAERYWHAAVFSPELVEIARYERDAPALPSSVSPLVESGGRFAIVPTGVMTLGHGPRVFCQYELKPFPRGN